MKFVRGFFAFMMCFFTLFSVVDVALVGLGTLPFESLVYDLLTAVACGVVWWALIE